MPPVARITTFGLAAARADPETVIASTIATRTFAVLITDSPSACYGLARLSSTFSHRPLGLELALARVVDDLTQDARQLLRRVEAHGVLGGHEVEPPLRLALLVGGRL